MVAGSQNGFDNSGRRGDVHWVSEDYPQDNANVARTIIIQDKIAANMARWIEEGAFKRETLYGISLLNEPAGWWDKVCLLEIVFTTSARKKVMSQTRAPKVWSACTDEFYPGGYEVVRWICPSLWCHHPPNLVPQEPPALPDGGEPAAGVQVSRGLGSSHAALRWIH